MILTKEIDLYKTKTEFKKGIILFGDPAIRELASARYGELFQEILASDKVVDPEPKFYSPSPKLGEDIKMCSWIIKDNIFGRKEIIELVQKAMK